MVNENRKMIHMRLDQMEKLNKIFIEYQNKTKTIISRPNFIDKILEFAEHKIKTMK
jgi:hypothetical protein